MEIGQLNKRITILKKSKPGSKDSDGYTVKEWGKLTELWANVKDLSGRSFYQLNAEQQIKTLTFTTWYKKDIDESMRVKYGEDIYRIMRIYQGEHSNSNKFMCLDCQIIKGVSD